MIRFSTAGESHGPCLVTIIEGIPAGLPVSSADLDTDLARRQKGYGRGKRQQIERDRARVLSGIVGGKTIGSPVALMVTNRDFENWKERDVPVWTRPRPGHADLAGSAKYGIVDYRLVAERASARETAARVAAGGLAKTLLRSIGVTVGSYVHAIGDVSADLDGVPLTERISGALTSDVACPDPTAAAEMRGAIDAAREAGDSLGGLFDVVALGLPLGLGSHVQWDRRLDGQIAQALMSIQAIKGVQIGPAFQNAGLPGTQVHDALYPGPGGPVRRTNRAGGLEGGMTNGEQVVVTAAMKPIPTTIAPQPTVDAVTGEAASTEYQRSDGCAVPAAAVVGEAMLALALASALTDRFGGDTLAGLQSALEEANARA